MDTVVHIFGGGCLFWAVALSLGLIIDKESLVKRGTLKKVTALDMTLCLLGIFLVMQ